MIQPTDTPKDVRLVVFLDARVVNVDAKINEVASLRFDFTFILDISYSNCNEDNEGVKSSGNMRRGEDYS